MPSHDPARAGAVILALAVSLAPLRSVSSSHRSDQAVTFDVVSIKPSQPGSPGGPGPFVNTTPGRLVARGTLAFLIEYAYGINGMFVEGGPAWVRSDRFDIDARQAPGSESFPLMRVMLRAALADRFRLTAHQE